MGLDPFTALSTAATVVQFVDFGTKLISKGYEIYRSADGVLTENAEQKAVASKLAELTRNLGKSLDPSLTWKKLSPAETALQEAAAQCQDYAIELADAFGEFRNQGKHRKWKSFQLALKDIWKAEEIDKRLVKLDRLRQQVMIHLLIYME